MLSLTLVKFSAQLLEPIRQLSHDLLSAYWPDGFRRGNLRLWHLHTAEWGAGGEYTIPCAIRIQTSKAWRVSLQERGDNYQCPATLVRLVSSFNLLLCRVWRGECDCWFNVSGGLETAMISTESGSQRILWSSLKTVSVLCSRALSTSTRVSNAVWSVCYTINMIAGLEIIVWVKGCCFRASTLDQDVHLGLHLCQVTLRFWAVSFKWPEAEGCCWWPQRVSGVDTGD